MAKSTEIDYSPIGIFYTSQVHPYEAGRQPDDHSSQGVIVLQAGNNFEQALIGLEKNQRIWILFSFHHNQSWKPMVLPPRGRDNKIGVFATRSPYRPNGIGLSCVQILNIDGLRIEVSGSDILNESPVLDIKPYLATSDSFPNELPAWLGSAEAMTIHFSPRANLQLHWLETQGLLQFRQFLVHQLEYEPTNSKKKRVKKSDLGYVIAYRTWRASFEVAGSQIQIISIDSGYTQSELNDTADPYEDKALHRLFLLNKF